MADTPPNLPPVTVILPGGQEDLLQAQRDLNRVRADLAALPYGSRSHSGAAAARE